MWSFYINYLFIEFTENVLYRDTYRYRDMNDLYRDVIFWSYRPALMPHTHLRSSDITYVMDTF